MLFSNHLDGEICMWIILVVSSEHVLFTVNMEGRDAELHVETKSMLGQIHEELASARRPAETDPCHLQKSLTHI